MKRLDMNTVISWGLVVMGVLSVAGWIAYSIHTGTSGGTEIPIAISSGLVGVLTGKNVAQPSQSKTGEALEKVAKTATEAQKAVETMENIKGIVKK